METVILADKSLTFEEFVAKISEAIVKKLAKEMKNPKKERISQNQAFRTFGQANVRRWLRTNRLKPVAKRPGKIEFLVKDLEKLYSVQQDYLYV